MMDIKGDLHLWFINFLINRTQGVVLIIIIIILIIIVIIIIIIIIVEAMTLLFAGKPKRGLG